MKRALTVLLVVSMTVSLLSGCGAAVSAVSDSTGADVSVSVSEEKKTLSLTPVSEDGKLAVNASVAEEEESELTGVTNELGDIDGDGTADYTVDYLVENGDIITGRIEFYLNGELIYTIDDELPIDTGSAKYADYDGDGKEEILFVYYPHVNSMPLDEYVVLKRNQWTWKKLKTPVDINGSNYFPVRINYGDEPCKLVISCDGYDEVINYDAKKHYEKAVEDLEAEGGSADFIAEFKRVLAGEGFEAGREYGVLLPWGTWQVEPSEYEGEECIKLLFGVAGPLERYDQIGNLYIYFRFDEWENIKILGMEFFDEAEPEE